MEEKVKNTNYNKKYLAEKIQIIICTYQLCRFDKNNKVKGDKRIIKDSGWVVMAHQGPFRLFKTKEPAAIAT